MGLDRTDAGVGHRVDRRRGPAVRRRRRRRWPGRCRPDPPPGRPVPGSAPIEPPLQRDDHAVSGLAGAQEGPGHARDGPATPVRSRPRCRRGCRSRGRRRGGPPARLAIIQSGQATPGAVTSWPSQVIAALEVGEGARAARPRSPPAGPRRPAGRIRSGSCRRRRRTGRRRGPAWPGTGRGSRHRVGAEQDQAARCDPRAPRRACRRRRGRARRAGRRPSGARTRPARRRGSTRPGSRPGARPMSRAPWTLARRRADRNAAPGMPAPARRRPRHELLRLGQRRPAQDHDDRRRHRAVLFPCLWRQRARTASMVGRGHARRPRRAGSDAGRPGPRPAGASSPGPVQQRLGRRSGVSPVAPGSARRRAVPPSTAACAEAQVQDRQLVFDVGAEQDHQPRRGRPGRWSPGAGRGPPRRGGRRRAGRRRCRCRAPCGPAWPRRRRPRWAAGPRR